MTGYDVRRLALVLATQAEIEGMKRYNEQNPGNMGYGQEEFEHMRDRLNQLAYAHDDELKDM